MRLRVGAPGVHSWDEGGGLRCVLRLERLGIRGAPGMGLMNIDAERVTISAELKLRFALAYRGESRGWTAADSFNLDILRLEQRCDGGCRLADTGLPLPELPPGLLHLVAQLVRWPATACGSLPLLAACRRASIRRFPRRCCRAWWRIESLHHCRLSWRPM